MYRNLLLILPVLVLLAAGCGGRQVGIMNPIQPQVVNQTDSFSFQATNVTNTTQTFQYTWQNTGTTADVTQSSQVTSGLGTLMVMDSMGQQLYLEPLSVNGTFLISSGTAGAWTIEVVLSNVEGTLNFSVQRP